MTPEQHLQRAQQLAQSLVNVDDNEVKKVYSFLCRNRKMEMLHELLELLPKSPFKDRSKSTFKHYTRMKEMIPMHLPKTIDVCDAIQILGWACRLLRYEAAKREKQESGGEFSKRMPRGKPTKRR